MTRHRVVWGIAALDIVTILVTRLIDPSGDVGAIIIFTLGVGLFAGVGALLDTRVRGNAIGPLLLTAGTLMAAAMAMVTYSSLGAIQAPKWPLSDVVRLAGSVLFVYPFMFAFIGVPLVFPDGRLPSRPFRWIILLTIASGAAWTMGSILGPGPGGEGDPGTPAGGVAGIAGVIQTFFLLSTIVCFGAGVAAVALRYRGGDRVQRQQIKWLAAIVSLGSVVLPVSFIAPNAGDAPAAVISSLTILSLFALPGVIGLAILRYRLYEIDRIISRTISWTLTTGLVGGLFAAAVIGLQGPLAEVTGGNTLTIAGSTLVAAALFQPLRRRIQRAADRRFDRGRYDAQRTVDSFAERLRDEIDLGTLRTTLIATADEAVRPATSNVWLRVAPKTDR